MEGVGKKRREKKNKKSSLLKIIARDHPDVATYMEKTDTISFLPAKDLGHGDYDPVCRICFDWCTNGSSVSNRYENIQGCFTTRNPEAEEMICDDKAPDVIPVCDQCANENKIWDFQDPGKEFVFMGESFSIDSIFRGND